jgi:hypothetical protein
MAKQQTAIEGLKDQVESMGGDSMASVVMVIGVSRYNFKNDETGEMISGTKVHYFDAEYSTEENLTGFVPQSANLPFDFYGSLPVIPAYYEPEFKITLKGKRPSIKFVGFKLLHEAIIAPKTE